MQRSTRKRWWLATILAGLLVGLMGSALAGPEHDALRDSAVTPGSKAEKLSSCVESKEEMRRNHMEYLKHDRDYVVHRGVRDVKHGLAQCVDCHAARDASGAYIPINHEKQFCAHCHDYTAVHITCFQCHRKTPEGQ